MESFLQWLLDPYYHSTDTFWAHCTNHIPYHFSCIHILNAHFCLYFVSICPLLTISLYYTIVAKWHGKPDKNNSSLSQLFGTGNNGTGTVVITTPNRTASAAPTATAEKRVCLGGKCGGRRAPLFDRSFRQPERPAPVQRRRTHRPSPASANATVAATAAAATVAAAAAATTATTANVKPAASGTGAKCQTVAQPEQRLEVATAAAGYQDPQRKRGHRDLVDNGRHDQQPCVDLHVSNLRLSGVERAAVDGHVETGRQRRIDGAADGGDADTVPGGAALPFRRASGRRTLSHRAVQRYENEPQLEEGEQEE